MDRPDQLRELFRMQKLLNERIGVQTDGMSEEEKTKWVLNYCRAMTQELAELTDSVPWKWWAKYRSTTSKTRSGSGGLISFPDQPRPGARHERRRCI